MDGIRQQIAIAARANQRRSGTIWKKAPQNQGENKQPVMPERANVIFHYWLAENTRAIVNFVTQRACPGSQQTNSKRDQTPRKPAFDFQLFLRDVFADSFSAQRYAPGLGNPI